MQIHTGFHGPRPTREHTHEDQRVSFTGLSPTTATLPRMFNYTPVLSLRPPTAADGKMRPTTPNMQHLPAITHARFSLIRVRSPLLTEYLFLRVLRCFTSPRSRHTPYTFRRRQPDMTRARFPHSDTLGSQLVCQLPEAYRRLPRPSSAPDAKASTVCP